MVGSHSVVFPLSSIHAGYIALFFELFILSAPLHPGVLANHYPGGELKYSKHGPLGLYTDLTLLQFIYTLVKPYEVFD